MTEKVMKTDRIYNSSKELYYKTKENRTRDSGLKMVGPFGGWLGGIVFSDDRYFIMFIC